MRVKIVRSDGFPNDVHELEIDLDFIPRVGERLQIDGDERWDNDGMDWFVQFVTYHIHTSIRDFHAVISVSRMPKAPPLNIWIEWADPSDRPSWLAGEVTMTCDAIPRQGDLIEIGVNAEDFNPDDVVVVEVSAVAYNTLKTPIQELEGDLSVLEETQVGIVVIKTDGRERSDIQRIIARRN